jgi:hypothetical protein
MIRRGVDAGATKVCHGQYVCRQVADFLKKRRRHSERKQPDNIVLR